MLFKKQKTQFKRKIAKTTGIPTTKSGRKRKLDRMGSQMLGWVVIAVIVIWFMGK